MNKAGKVWGSVQVLFDKSNVEVHRIEIKKGGYSSKHRHLHKCNIFYVEKGKIRIKVWKKDYPLCDETILEEGQMTVVKPGEYHLFESLEGSIVYEIYYLQKICPGDIERENCGGVKE